MNNKQDKTTTEILQWCEVQEENTKKTIDLLLDTKDWKDKKTKKALTIASKILKNVDELKQTTIDIIIK
jgi:hypothetical protein